MKVHIDRRTNAIYFRMNDSKIVESEEVYPGIILDFDKRKKVVAIEILRTKNRTRKAALARQAAQQQPLHMKINS